MLEALFITQIIIFALIFIKLWMTNHWTIGKKLLVALVSGIIVETGALLAILNLKIPMIAIISIKLPVLIIGGLMCYYFYRSDFRG